jgi:glycine/D-amino acid oxidase-like deaminating enzyme
MDLSQLDQQKKVALVGAAGVVGLGALAYLAKGGKRTNWVRSCYFN